MKIFLLGFMGSGKSTHGKKLSAKLGLPFFDLDSLIVEAAGMSIPDYFAKIGEQGFRDLESKTLQQYPFPDDCIVALGGGAPCFNNNMDWLVKQGFTVYISMPAEALASRLERSRTVRPVLQGKQGPELVQFIREKLQERERFYKKAQLVVNGIGLTTEKLRIYLKR